MGLIKKLIHKMSQKKDRRALKAIFGICSMVLASLFLALVFYAQSFAAGPDVFAQEAGNEFNYQGTDGYGSYNLKETVSLDTSTFPTPITLKRPFPLIQALFQQPLTNWYS